MTTSFIMTILLIFGLSCWMTFLLGTIGAALLGFLLAWLLRNIALARVSKKLEERQGAYNQLEEDHNSFVYTHEQLQNDYNDLQEKESDLNQQVTDKNAQVEIVEGKYNALLTQKNELLAKVEDLEKKPTGIDINEYETLQQKYEQSLLEQKENNKLIAHLKEEKEGLTSDLSALKINLPEDNEANDALVINTSVEKEDDLVTEEDTDDSNDDTSSSSNEETIIDPVVEPKSDTEVADKINKAWDNFTGKVKGKFSKIKDTTTDKLADLKDNATGKISNLKDAANDKLEAIKNDNDVEAEGDKEPFWDTPITELAKKDKGSEDTDTTNPSTDIVDEDTTSEKKDTTSDDTTDK